MGHRLKNSLSMRVEPHHSRLVWLVSRGIQTMYLDGIEHFLESVPFRIATPRAVQDRLKYHRDQEI